MQLNLKIGDLIRCFYGFHVGVGFAKVNKIIHRSTREEYSVYENVITGNGSKNSPIEVLVNFVGYELSDDTLSTIVPVDESRCLDPHDIWNVLSEDDLLELKASWDKTVKDKFNFLYTHVNRENLGGRKILPNMKF